MAVRHSIHSALLHSVLVVATLVAATARAGEVTPGNAEATQGSSTRDTMTLQNLLASAPSPAAANVLLDYVQALPGRIARGDLMIGILSVEEVKQAPSALEQAASWGAPAAWLELARWHAAPPLGAPDLVAMERALGKARELCVPGTELETVRLRWFYRRDDATPAERAETYRLARQLFDRGQDTPRAAYYLGLLTSQGFGTTASPAEAVNWQRVAASQGDGDALFELYVHYETGVGVVRDSAIALDWLKKAAEQGQPRAMYNLGALLATGRGGVRQDSAAAFAWYRKASAAGNVRATVMLAVMYARGEGVGRNIEAARRLFEEAEYAGYDTAPFRRQVGL
jgi:TPR repeat protein